MRKMIAVCILLCAVSLYAQDAKKYISILGEAEIILPADQAGISVQVKTIEQSSEMSKQKMDSALNEALETIKEFGLDNKSVSISPVLFGKNIEYGEKGRQVNGYYSMVTVNIILKDLSKYYDLLNRLSVIPVLEIVSSDYSVTDIPAHNREAYEKALKAAREKASYMAKAMDASLGDVQEIEEGMPILPAYAYTANVQSRAESPDPAFSGQVKISKTLRVKFGLK